MNLLTMVRLWKHPNGIYYIIYSRKKKNTLSTKDHALAQRLFRKLRQAYLERKVEVLTGQLPGKTLVDFWEEYEEHRFRTARPMTCQTDRQAFRVFRKALGDDTPVTRITRRQVEHSLASMGQRVSPISANTWFRHFKAALSKAREWGYLRVNPCDGIKQLAIDEPLHRNLTQTDFLHLLEVEPDPNFRRFWELSARTGCRRSELLQLTLEAIDWQGQQFTVRITKNRRLKIVPMSPRIMELLREIPVQIGKLFPWKPDSVTHHFKKTARAAGLPQVRLHDLRHSYCSWLVQAGIALQIVQQLAGHRNLKTTEHYAHLNREQQIQAQASLRIVKD